MSDCGFRRCDKYSLKIPTPCISAEIDLGSAYTTGRALARRWVVEKTFIPRVCLPSTAYFGAK